jgi:hypothetical protein
MASGAFVTDIAISTVPYGFQFYARNGNFSNNGPSGSGFTQKSLFHGVRV